LAIRTESEDHPRRVRWLAGRLAIGQGRLEEALVCFRQLQAEFLARGNSFDAALAALDLVKIHLLRGEKDGPIQRLLREMSAVFADSRLHPNVREALEEFRAAVARATASVDFIELVILYLLRAREAPILRFELPRK
jgi:hypothetical protein